MSRSRIRAFIVVSGIVALAVGPAALDASEDLQVPPSIAGKWTMSIDLGQGPLNLPMEFKLDGKKLTGTVASPEGDPTNLEGEYADGKISFNVVIRGGSMTITFKGALKDDGSIGGTLDMQGNEIAWTATRAKD
jgi:hypothetical protein